MAQVLAWLEAGTTPACGTKRLLLERPSLHSALAHRNALDLELYQVLNLQPSISSPDLQKRNPNSLTLNPEPERAGTAIVDRELFWVRGSFIVGEDGGREDLVGGWDVRRRNHGACMTSILPLPHPPARPVV